MRSSRWFKSQTLRVESRIISYSTEMYWRLQDYSYKMQENRIDDYWNIDGSRDFSDFLGQFSHNLQYEKRNLQKDTCDAEDD